MRTAMSIAMLTTLTALTAQPGSQGSDLFAPAMGSPVRVGAGSGTVVLADLDRDGHADMLTRHLLTKHVTVMRGNGRGGFERVSVIRLDYEPGDMAAGDLDKDGIVDLAITPGREDVVDVYLGRGNGTFAKTAASPIMVRPEVEPFNKRTLRLADLNEDGNPDIVTANGRRRNGFGVLFGDGRGGFTAGPYIRLDTGRDGYVFAFGDLDRDGHLDVVSASRAGYEDSRPGRVSIQFGNGRGAFTAAPHATLTVLSSPSTVTLADANGDGRPDVLITHERGQLTVLLNSDGTRFAHADGSPFNAGLQTHSMRVADVNDDRHVDLIAATVDTVTVLLGDGRRFALATGSPFKAGPGAYDLTLGDVNGDGKADVVASSFEGDAVTVLLHR